MKLLSAVVVLMLASSSLAARAQTLGAGEWVRVRAPHVVVYSDAGAARAASVAERLEQFHTLVAEIFPPPAGAPVPPVTVLAFGDARQLARLKPLYGGKPAEFSGLFLPSRERAIVLLDAAADGRSTRVILHEYTHRVVDLHGGPAPLWLGEGLAELYSTATVEGGRGEVGAPVGAHLELLRAGGLMALERLFAVGAEDPEYNEARQQGALYATAWAFAHYWVMTDPERGRERLGELARRLAFGEPAESAFAGAFSRPLAGFAAELDAYVRRETFARRSVELRTAPRAPEAAEPAPRDELESYFGFALALQRRYAEAVPHFDRARQLNPSSPLPYEGLGTLALLRGSPEEAREAFREAIRRGSTSPRANLAFAEASLELGVALRDGETRLALERAVALNPSAPEPYAMLSTMARLGKEYETALAWAERGARAAPEDGAVRLALGQAQLALGRYAAARGVLRRVASTEENAAIRRTAADAVASLDRYEAAVAPSEAKRGAGGAERVDRPLAVFEELMPYFHFAPAALSGHVERVDCTAGEVSVTVRVGGRRLVYSSPAAADVRFHTLNYNGLELLDCDVAVGRDAIVEIEPSPDDRFGGVLKAVIFLNPVRPAPAARKT